MLPPGAAWGSTLLPATPPKMAGLYLHPLLRPEVPLLQEVHPRECNPGHNSPPLPSQDGPSPLPWSPLGVLATSSNSPIGVSCLEPSPVYHEPNVRLLTSGLQVDHQQFLLYQLNLFAQGSLSPPLPVLIHHQCRLAGLRLICSPPEVNPASARLPKSVSTFLPDHASSLARGKITSQP